MTKYIISLITLVTCPLLLNAQQDGHFSQGIFNQGYINPGSYGSDVDGMFCATVINRMQTKGFDGAPTTTVLNINGPLDFINSGIGLSLFNDKIGYLKTPGFKLGYSYIFELPNDGKLGMGTSLGMINSKFDRESWRLPDGSAGDVAIPTQSKDKTSLDFGLGVYYTTNKFFAGLSCMHINKPALTDTKIKTSFAPMVYITAGYNFIFGITDDYEFKPSVYIGTDFSVGKYTANAHLFYKKKYWCGISYRLDEAIVFNLGLELFKNFRVGYSYDYLTTDMQRYSNGTHEIFASYRFTLSLGKRNNQRKSVRYL